MNKGPENRGSQPPQPNRSQRRQEQRVADREARHAGVENPSRRILFSQQQKW